MLQWLPQSLSLQSGLDPGYFSALCPHLASLLFLKNTKWVPSKGLCIYRSFCELLLLQIHTEPVPSSHSGLCSDVTTWETSSRPPSFAPTYLAVCISITLISSDMTIVTYLLAALFGFHLPPPLHVHHDCRNYISFTAVSSKCLTCNRCSGNSC